MNGVDPVPGPLPGADGRMLYVYIRRLRAKFGAVPDHHVRSGYRVDLLP
jgi:hypothetical protein